jgi:arsenite methyltransferase
VQLPDGIVCNSTLRAPHIGSAMQQDDYRSAIEAAGLRIRTVLGQSKLPVHLR